MHWLWTGMALALVLAGCRSEQDRSRPGGRAESAPGVTAPMPPVPAPSGSAQLNPPPPATADAGPLSAPPSTAMPGVRPLYPADAGTRR